MKHSKSCQKYKNKKCLTVLEKFFTDRAIVSLPLKDDLSEDVKRDILKGRERVLSKIFLNHIENILRKFHQ